MSRTSRGESRTPQDRVAPESAASLAKRLLEERDLHSCNCGIAVNERSPDIPVERGGRNEDRNYIKSGQQSSLMGIGSVGGRPAGRGRTGSSVSDDAAGSSEESGETIEEKLPYHVHIVERCPNGNTVVTFVPEPEANTRGHFLGLPVVVSKFWTPDMYRVKKPERCVVKTVVSIATLLLVAVVCFLAGYFAVDSRSEEPPPSYRKGRVAVQMEASMRQPFRLFSESNTSQQYQHFANNFTKSIDGIFATSFLSDLYSHCTLERIRHRNVVEFTVYLHGLPTSREDEGARSTDDPEAQTRRVVEGILHDAVLSDRLRIWSAIDVKSIRVTQVIFSLRDGSTATPPALWPVWTSVLHVEPGLLNQPDCGLRPGHAPPHTRILGGVDSIPGSWPWLGSMQYQLGTEIGHRCAASLVNQDWAITAAHCVDEGLADILDHIIFGDWDLEGDSPSRQRVSVQSVVVHPGYSSSRQDNDLALLRLSRPVRFDDNVWPVCIESQPYEVERYRECYIAGWGHTQEYGNVSRFLQEAKIPLVSKASCATKFRDRVSETYSVITDNMICAGKTTGGVDSCQSDSGGSLTCRGHDGSWRIVGVTSFGYGCGRPEYPGVYTRLSRYWEYISSVLREDKPSITCQKLTEPLCQDRLPYTNVFPYSQGDLAQFLTVLPNSSGSATESLDRRLRETLVCLTVFPSCELTGKAPVVPCREFCQDTVDVLFSLLARCQKYPTGNTSDAIFCRQGISADCGPSQVRPSLANHSVIESPYLPAGFNIRSVGCSWLVTGPADTVLVFKFTRLKFPSKGRGKVITVGTGNNVHNRSSVVHKLFGPEVPRPLVINNSQAWLSFASVSHVFHEVPEEFYFTVEVHALDINQRGLLSDICRSGLGNCTSNSEPCYPARWRCDGITDCANREDEADCSKTPHGVMNTTSLRTPP